MRLAFDNRRLLGRVRGLNGWTLLELALLALIALQLARLIWTAATPVGPLGDWRGPDPAGASVQTGLLAEFDPFFRLSGAGGPVTVTSLNLKLFGIRQDQASGQGSAIIAGSDGQQRSIAVGEEIEPGVTLKSVGFDSVTISRGGADEQLFMDQSDQPVTVAPANVPSPVPTAPVAQPSSSVEPGGPPVPPSNVPPPPGVRPQGGGGGGDALSAFGVAPGDVVRAVNGRRIAPGQQAQVLAAAMSSRKAVTVQVERDGRMVTLRPGAGR